MSNPAPDALTGFFGREAELAALDRAFAGGDRLVTLTGMSGMGKSRLALHMMEAARARGPVLWSSVGEAEDADGIAAAVALAAGEPLAAGQTGEAAATHVANVLEARGPLLLVLDDFAALTAHAPATVGVWLARAPELRVLVTSQARLQLASEVVLELPPLSLPGTPAELEHSEAVQLLVDRARRVRRDFTIRDDERAIVAEIARQLDGIPLALELAAARMSVLSPREVLERLANRFELLRRGDPGARRREDTLLGAIEWSWELLGPIEQSALLQCSVFRGGFTVPAAEQVLACGEVPVLDVLQALRDRSLLRRLEAPSPTASPRLALYGSVHAYAAAKLQASSEAEAVLRRHTAHYLQRGAELAARVEEQGEGLEELAAEQDNLLSVVDRAFATRPPTSLSAETALRALLALDPVRAGRGPIAPYLRLLDQALSPRGALAIDPALRVRALEARARIQRIAGHADAAAVDLEAAVMGAESLRDERLVARTATELAKTRFAQCRFRDAQTMIERALELHRRTGEPRGEGFALAWLGVTRLELGHAAEARGHLDRALALLRAAGDRRNEAFCLFALGMVHEDEDRLAEARRRLEESLVLARAVGDRWTEGACRVELGMTALAEDKLAEARALLADGCSMLETVDPRFVAYGLAHLAGIDALEGRAAEAEQKLARAESMVVVMDSPSERSAVDLQRGLLDLVLARTAERAQTATEHRQAARARAARARASGNPPPFDVRRSVRLLERALERMDAAEPGPEGTALLVDPEGRWFQVPAGPRVSCAKRQAMRSILVRLAQHRIDAPGKALTADDLLEAGWKGEKMIPSAAKNRLYVTIATLRKIGLKDLLRGGDDGYLLDPEVPCRMVRQ